jgi:TRAP-type C4-dicarboxylate transport system permease small subunit
VTLTARGALHALHRAGGFVAGVLLVAVCALTLVPIAARLLGLPAHSWDEVATFCMAASAFMGLAATWRAGVHVRMELIVARLKGTVRRVVETVALFITLAACGYFTGYATRFAIESFRMDDVSQGLLPIPLWLPQSGMVIGLVLLCLAVAESLLDTLRGAAAPANEDAVINRAVNEL